MLPVDLSSKYFSWLYDIVAGRKNYRKLCQYLHDRWEFRWTIPNDDNRQEDGYDLRYQFLEFYEAEGIAFSQLAVDRFLEKPVSVFEVLVALTYRMDFQLYDKDLPPRNPKWFAEMLDNLGIADLINSGFTHVAMLDVDRVMQTLLDRTYAENGEGSLFPLDHPGDDMTKVEIWYQLMSYVMEKYPQL